MCFDDDSHPPMPLSAGSSAHGEDVTVTASDGTDIPAYMASPGQEARAQVVILPDARGLHNFYKELALRFADVGVRALAFDYFARTADGDDRTESFDYMAHIQQMTSGSFGLDLDAALRAITRGPGQGLPTLTVGFCLGGSLSLRAGSRRHPDTGEPLAGVISFYASLTREFGPVTPSASYAQQIQCPVLAMFGGADQGIPQSDIDSLEDGLQKAGVTHEIVVYPGAPHSFFDRKAQEFATASADSWTRVQEFISRREAVEV